jgi:hypothetical protein
VSRFHFGSVVIRRAVLGWLFFFPGLMIAETTIWFCPQDPVNRPSMGYGGSPQYTQLFSPGAAWGDSLKRVSVFKIYPQWINQGSDEDLRNMFSYLRGHGIALALEYGPLSRSQDCASGITGEGSGGQELGRVAQKIRKEGGDLKYLAMDEPLFFTGLAPEGRCSWPVEKVASDAANNINAMKAVFPNMQVGDTEPLGSDKMPVGQQIARYRAGIEAFQRTLGAPLAFFQLDLLWHAKDLAPGLKEAKAMLESERVPLGVIYDGSSKSNSDDEWLRLTEQHIQLVESTIGPPALAIFQSWHRYPQRLLPDTDPDSFTYLIREYHSK